VTDLEEVVLDLERHAASEGWDSPPRLYALVETGLLRTSEPDLAERLGIPPDTETIAALEQPSLPDEATIEDSLGMIAWPSEVTGCALVIERVVLPPDAEEDIPSGDPEEEAAFVLNHPGREDVRVVVGVLRDGSRHSVLRLRSHDDEADLMSGADLVPHLADALAASFDPDIDPGLDTDAGLDLENGLDLETGPSNGSAPQT
jgi:hypothetical protein